MTSMSEYITVKRNAKYWNIIEFRPVKQRTRCEYKADFGSMLPPHRAQSDPQS